MTNIDQQHPLPAPTSGAAPADGRAAERPPWPALAVVLTGLFIATLDFFIVNVALPSLADDLATTASQLQLVVAGYGIAYGCLLVTGGRLGDLFGPRRVFALGMVGFLVASTVCGLAPSSLVLVVARIAQGAAAAAVSPQALAIVTALFHGRHRARALTAYSLTMGVAAVFGQLIGGALIAIAPGETGWRWCFLVNLPLGGVALALTRRLVPATVPQRRARLDLTGTILVTLALAALVVPLVQGREHGWPLWTWLTLACSPVLGAVLTRHLQRSERRGGSPVVAPALFRHPAFASGLVVQAALWSGQASLFYVLALYLQRGAGLTALGAGAIFALLGAGYVAGSMAAPRIARRHGSAVVCLGALLMAAGLAALLALTLAISSDVNVLLLAPGLLVDGVGMGLAIAPLAGIVLAHIPPDSAGTTSGVFSATAQAGNAVGVAVVGVAFYMALDSQSAAGYGHAFRIALVVLMAVELLVAALASRLVRSVRA